MKGNFLLLSGELTSPPLVGVAPDPSPLSPVPLFIEVLLSPDPVEFIAPVLAFMGEFEVSGRAVEVVTEVRSDEARVAGTTGATV